MAKKTSYGIEPESISLLLSKTIEGLGRIRAEQKPEAAAWDRLISGAVDNINRERQLLGYPLFTTAEKKELRKHIEKSVR